CLRDRDPGPPRTAGIGGGSQVRIGCAGDRALGPGGESGPRAGERRGGGVLADRPRRGGGDDSGGRAASGADRTCPRRRRRRHAGQYRRALRCACTAADQQCDGKPERFERGCDRAICRGDALTGEQAGAHRMTIATTIRRTAMAGFACAAALLLTGCLLSPGVFTSQLELRKGGSFSYTYDGEIYLLALSKLADLGNAAEDAADEFVEQACYDDETFEERPCTEEELAQQKSDWEQQAEQRKQEREREAEMTRAMLGGIDPADPEVAQEFAERLQRQAGWESVEDKGDR